VTTEQLTPSPPDTRGSTALQPAEAGQPLSARQLIARLLVIQDVMKQVMQQDVDYGVIPGTPKPTLFKPGAEKLCVTFRLSADSPEIEQVPDYLGDIRYRVRVPIRAHDGTVLAVGVGECSTGEEKYRWRRPVHPAEFTNAPEDRKRQKYQRNGDVWDQVRVEPSDVANTVLKMAHKRAYVHGVIMATAAGSIFTQDIEDAPEGLQPEPTGKAPIQPPQRKAAPPPGAGDTVRLKFTAALPIKRGTSDKGPWEKFGFNGSDRKSYGTFDTGVAAEIQAAMAAGLELDVVFVEGKYGRDIKAITVLERQAGDEF